MEGDPPGTALVRSLREAVDAGLVHKNMQTLVDLTNFTGSVDWGALQAIRKMAPWGEGSEPALPISFKTMCLPLPSNLSKSCFQALIIAALSAPRRRLPGWCRKKRIEVEAPACGMAGFP